MMKAIKNFMKKPITWGDSFKWSAYKDKAERLDKYNSFKDMDNQI